MKWERGSDRSNVEDVRGQGGGGGGFRGMPIRMSLGGLVVLGVLSLVTGRNFLGAFLGGGGGGNAALPTSGPKESTPEEDELVDFMTFVLNDTQSTWRRVLGSRYRDARLVIFSDQVQSGCGPADAGMGPFYCPADEKVYLDLSFFQELRQRFGAPGDFAQAYVLAHEIGHHVQHVLGTDRQMREQQDRYPNKENELSVRLELQADCYAGIWANSSGQRQLLEGGDIEEAMRAAQVIGDDALQRQAGRRVNPESFTHGSSAQRMHWFDAGKNTGDVNSCDTFASAQL